MKRTVSNVLVISLALVFFTGLTSMVRKRVESGALSPQEVELNAPDKVFDILESSCFDCHMSTSKNEKARKKMSFDKFSKLSPMNLTAILNDLNKATKEGKMPPEKYLDKYPEKKLTQAEIEAIAKWTSSRSKAFIQ